METTEADGELQIITEVSHVYLERIKNKTEFDRTLCQGGNIIGEMEIFSRQGKHRESKKFNKNTGNLDKAGKMNKI